MNGYRLRVWVVTCFLVSMVVSGFSYAAQSLRICYGAGVYLDSSVDLLHSVRIKKGRILLEVVWMRPDVSI